MAPGSPQKKKKKERKVVLFPLVNVQEDGNRSVTDCKMVQRLGTGGGRRFPLDA